MKWREKITFGMLIVSMLFSTAVLGSNLWMQEKEQIKFVILRNRISAERERISATAEVKRTGDKMMKSLNGEERTVLPEYQELAEINPDFVGWIFIDGTNIDYPVMQTQDDPEFYLRRNFQKEHATAGVPFMDASSDIFVPTSNFLIYGHNMKNGTMFHDMLKYKDKSFYQEHKTFRFDTIYKGGQGTYEIIAAGYSKIYPEDSDAFKYYQYAGITSRSDFNEYLKGVKELSEYNTGVSAEYGDQLVTLSTCAYHEKNGRFFIVGKRTDAKQVKPQ